MFRSLRSAGMAVAAVAAVLAVFATLALAAPALAQTRTVYVPHITKGDPVWQDYLVVSNSGRYEASYFIAYYDEGVVLGSVKHTLAPGADQSVALKAERPGASMAVVTYTDPDLVFRQIYRNTANGLAEFALTDSADYQIAFKFSNALGAGLLGWSGLALANPGDQSTIATLYALGHDGAVLGSMDQFLGPKSRVVGVHSLWFPSLSKDAIAQIVVRANEPTKLCGIVISGTNDAARLLFTPAFPQPGFGTAKYPADGFQLDLVNAFPRITAITYSMTDNGRLTYVSPTQGQVVIGLDRVVDGQATMLRAWSFSFDAQGFRYLSSTDLGTRLGLVTASPLSSSMPTVPYTSELEGTYAYYVNEINQGNVTVRLFLSIDGPWYLANFSVPSETWVLRLVEEYDTAMAVIVHHETTFWLAPGKGIRKLVCDGHEYDVTGVLVAPNAP